MATPHQTVIRGTEGNDVIVADGGNKVRPVQFVHGREGNDLICGGGGFRQQQFFGGRGADRIYGLRGYDRMLGGAGRDRLYGGPVPDDLTGGAGHHDFCFGGHPRRDNPNINPRSDAADRTCEHIESAWRVRGFRGIVVPPA
jgi:Ca2+-binding RTX toxin-like protein